MENSKISIRYAKALFELSIEKNVIDKIKEDITMISPVFNLEKNNNLFLNNPIIKTTKKKNLTTTVFGKHINPLTHTFLNLVLDKKREHFLDLIFRNFISFYNSYKKLKKVTLISASEIDNELKHKISSLLEKFYTTKIELIEEVEPEIIGGFILNIDDKQIDRSVRQQLNDLKHHLLSTSLN